MLTILLSVVQTCVSRTSGNECNLRMIIRTVTLQELHGLQKNESAVRLQESKHLSLACPFGEQTESNCFIATHAYYSLQT